MEDGSAAGVITDARNCLLALHCRNMGCNMQLKYMRTCRVIVVRRAKGSKSFNTLFSMHAALILDFNSTSQCGSLKYNASCHADGPFQPGQRALVKATLASPLLSSVKSVGPWLKFGMQNVDKAEAGVPTCRCPVFR